MSSHTELLSFLSLSLCIEGSRAAGSQRLTLRKYKNKKKTQEERLCKEEVAVEQQQQREDKRRQQ